jgi:hypothetical protein
MTIIENSGNNIFLIIESWLLGIWVVWSVERKEEFGGAEGGRTPYLFNAIESLSQLSYSPNSQLYQNTP